MRWRIVLSLFFLEILPVSWSSIHYWLALGQTYRRLCSHSRPFRWHTSHRATWTSSLRSTSYDMCLCWYIRSRTTCQCSPVAPSNWFVFGRLGRYLVGSPWQTLPGSPCWYMHVPGASERFGYWCQWRRDGIRNTNAIPVAEPHICTFYHGSVRLLWTPLHYLLHTVRINDLRVLMEGFQA